jgi:hypothetical protein
MYGDLRGRESLSIGIEKKKDSVGRSGKHSGPGGGPDKGTSGAQQRKSHLYIPYR